MKGPVKTMTLEEVQSHVGQEIGVSDWFLMDQERISAFADITEDHMFLHVDPEAAAATPFGGTIAHGLLTLSMMPVMAYQVVPGISGTKMGLTTWISQDASSDPTALLASTVTMWLLSSGIGSGQETDPVAVSIVIPAGPSRSCQVPGSEPCESSG